MSWFRRRKRDAPTGQELLEQGHADAASRRAESAAANPAAATGPFSMLAGDVYSLGGGMVFATGQVGSGTIRVGDTVAIQRGGHTVRTARVRSLQQLKDAVDSASAGDFVAVMFGDLERDQLQTGDELTASEPTG